MNSLGGSILEDETLTDAEKFSIILGGERTEGKMPTVGSGFPVFRPVILP